MLLLICNFIHTEIQITVELNKENIQLMCFEDILQKVMISHELHESCLLFRNDNISLSIIKYRFC